MKKFLSLVMIFIFISGSCPVFARDVKLYATVEETQLAETYIGQDISLFSTQNTLEQVLVTGWNNLATEISVEDYNISVSDIGNVYCGILYNNPKLYHVTTGFRYSYTTNTVISVLPIYRETDASVIEETMDAIDAATEEIMFCLDENMTDFEKVMTVHDYMVLHYQYDYTYSNYDITIMTTKTGVCMGYALAFMHLMNELGIECLYVSSEAMNHAWNLVKLDGEWYHIDLTWDDPGTNYGQVSHKYALLSDYEIQNLEDPHHGYDLKGIEADSDKYDKACWHEGVGAIVTIDESYYYVDGKNIVDQNGKIIYEDLDGGDNGWDIGGGYRLSGGTYAGLAEHNGILYFNTDEAVYSYDPENEKITKILDYTGICGLFIDRNTLGYCEFDMTTREFIEAGNYNLGKIRFGGTFHNDNKIIKRLYKESGAEDVCIYVDYGDCIQMEKVTKLGFSKISFDIKDSQTFFYWNDKMKPLKEKEVYSK